MKPGDIVSRDDGSLYLLLEKEDRLEQTYWFTKNYPKLDSPFWFGENTLTLYKFTDEINNQYLDQVLDSIVPFKETAVTDQERADYLASYGNSKLFQESYSVQDDVYFWTSDRSWQPGTITYVLQDGYLVRGPTIPETLSSPKTIALRMRPQLPIHDLATILEIIDNFSWESYQSAFQEIIPTPSNPVDLVREILNGNYSGSPRELLTRFVEATENVDTTQMGSNYDDSDMYDAMYNFDDTIQMVMDSQGDALFVGDYVVSAPPVLPQLDKLGDKSGIISSINFQPTDENYYLTVVTADGETIVGIKSDFVTVQDLEPVEPSQPEPTVVPVDPPVTTGPLPAQPSAASGTPVLALLVVVFLCLS